MGKKHFSFFQQVQLTSYRFNIGQLSATLAHRWNNIERSLLSPEAYPEKMKGAAQISKKTFNSRSLGEEGHALRKIFKKKKHQIVRFRGICAVKQRYDTLAEMSVF